MFRALIWKSGIDQNVLFVDGTPLPMVIIQNKLDKISELQEKANFMTMNHLEEFRQKNKFDLCFQTSAKTGENVEDSISGFIRLVIDKYERYLSTIRPKESVVEKESKTVVLNSNSNNTQNQTKNKSCC